MSIPKAKNPCTPDCPDRRMHCHGKCPRYKTFSTLRDIERQQRYAIRQVDDYIVERQVLSKMVPIVVQRRPKRRGA